MKKIAELPNQKDSNEFANMVSLLAVYSEASNRLEELQSEINREFLESVDEHQTEYAGLQETLTRTEAALEAVALTHPAWFQTKKSIKTPYGTLTTSKKLHVPNEEVTLVLLEAESKADAKFQVGHFIRNTPELNLEALEKLDDDMLARLRIHRVTDQNFKVDAAKVDMGKAVKEITKQAGQLKAA
ncbi:MAG: hypothetical protein JWQ71_4470 [Pedosphaera sp.]|nr:hypothetical protein [Pedosphaera sp.]